MTVTTNEPTTTTVKERHEMKEIETQFGEKVTLDCVVADQDNAQVEWKAAKNNLKGN